MNIFFQRRKPTHFCTQRDSMNKTIEAIRVASLYESCILRMNEEEKLTYLIDIL